MGLHQETYKKKKAKYSESDEKYVYNTPTLEGKYETYFNGKGNEEVHKMKQYFRYPLTEESYS